MKRLLLAVGALGSVGLMLMGAAPVPQTPADIAADLAAHPPADLNAIYALKTRLGSNGLTQVQSQLIQLAQQQTGADLKAGVAACRLPDWFDSEMPALALAQTVAGDAEWTADRLMIDRALAERTAEYNRVMAGDSVDPQYNDASGPAARALKDKPGSRQHDFAARVADDQFGRLGSLIVARQILWAKDVNPAVKAYLSGYNNAATCRSDRGNTAWLKSDLAAHGWPKLSTDGADMAGDAWLLVQHADHDPAFQKQVLPMLEALLPAKEVAGKSYAYLYDRVAMHDNRPLRYGSQGRCNGVGAWEPLPVEDPATLDARRAAVGLGPEADYIQKFAKTCASMVPPKIQ